MPSSFHCHTHTHYDNAFHHHHKLSEHVLLPNDSLPSGLYAGRHKLWHPVCRMHLHCNLFSTCLPYVSPWIHGHHISQPSQRSLLNVWLCSYLNSPSDNV
jgi:hypothetical protein